MGMNSKSGLKGMVSVGASGKLTRKERLAEIVRKARRAPRAVRAPRRRP